ncbi:arsenate reductase (glutaredoxin) [Gilvibacter sediminis]|uniref:arsenate reductase (glutaredoxin) n=1 Tax=Gilvibacter sediminis TaxID=379071 RepID=UPI002350354E|nr:arsenate reductase (glutaredoxin) [Gilvibacter sediminis]MDC7998198.1 arsenate reductase (glutaredoxin) [Gilvibacter sediminis]
MITIYHNPRCRKSREALQLLESSGISHDIRLYLTDPLSEQELKALIDKLGMTAVELIRKGEAVWKADYKGKELSEADLIKAMITEPKLIERPILSTSDAAVVGRPLEAAEAFLQILKQD